MSKAGKRQRQKRQGPSSQVRGESGRVKKEEPEDFKVEGADDSVHRRREVGQPVNRGKLIYN